MRLRRIHRPLVLVAVGIVLSLTAGARAARAQEEEPLASDRPDFTETSSTVGAGRVQIEGGWTYTHDSEQGVSVDTHDLPELLVRVGLNDESELRLGWEGWVSQRTRDDAGTTDTVDGLTDLEVGLKVELFEQCCCGLRPEAALIVAMTVPSGEEGFGSDEVQPVANLLYSWELTENWSLGGSTAIACPDEDGDRFIEMSQSVTTGIGLTDDVGFYLEWYTLLRHGAEDDRPEHYLDTGFTYSVTPNFQLDWRAGLGLNDRSDDFFTGAGFAVRY